MNDDPTLVLGGGGPVGGAWMTGVLAGLSDVGLDLTRTGTVIGTSGGAIFGARLASGEPAGELYARQLAGDDRVELNVTLAQTLRYLWAARGSRDPERSVRRLGRAALAARTGPESDLFGLVTRMLRGVRAWPDRTLRITAVDARVGHLHVFDASSPLTLPQAVAASCAVPLVLPPVHAAGTRWIDGGSRSTANIHLARGHRRVLAVAPVPAAVGPHPHAGRQAAQLVAEGSSVTLITPDRASRRAMGRDLTAVARCPDAARAGHAQAASLAQTVLDW
ncbi:patatin-like phospholipase family protein [Streptomyces sp. NPDC002033]|uniref:patatin-like phospholipase family protein n=1 Tax=unclassified Streptomyces TaxID=2593676 RepID=UPI0033167947